MVDEVLASDPRIKRIKADEKAARAAKKGGAVTNGAPAKPLSAADKLKLEKEKAAAEAATREQEKKAAELSKPEREAAKKAKEAARKNLKKWKKVGLMSLFQRLKY
jgi:DnaJ family protein C protein 2